MRVAIVNDRPAVIETLAMAIGDASDLQLCWTALDGREALDRCREDRPDLILMDLLTPGLDGIETTRRIMTEVPCPILVVTGDIQGGFSRVYEAISAGALDAVETPTRDTNGRVLGRDALLRKIAMIGSLTRTVPPRAVTRKPGRLPPIVAIGASTGGPSALSTLLRDLPPDLPAAILVVQHLDARFTEGLVTSLSQHTGLRVEAVGDETAPQPGRVYVAAREAHLILTEDGLLTYVNDPADAPHRPSIDVLFRRIAAHRTAAGCGVLLTGMGRDGADGLLALQRAGFLTLAQNEASSVIWGIPGAAVALGAADRILPLDELATAIDTHIRTLQPTAEIERTAR
ncbi:chemotaxis-specific protein-glutamate methyltransferase CheB [Methylolobus aquaticus]